ncbi:hypothetical protein [Halobellus litoreus]|uniref:PadR family transcriptional regulator n=1 Tax=Halobellus litoreus TaxID=755310 RepID=A0ABD6E666_9EURY|nr:hypothetical protein [Halobellus litoreus]
MSQKSLLPLAFLYAQGSSVDGATRFQKLVFLAQREGGLESKYDFHAEKFGPYSYDLADDLKYFIESGYVERKVETNEVGHERHTFRLTDEGYKVARKMAQKNRYEPIFDIVNEVKSKFNDWNLEELLRYVYRKYPELATATDLDTDRLFDPDSDSQFLEPAEHEFLHASPQETLEQNSSAEDVFSLD